MKHNVRYLKGILNFGLCYNKDVKLRVLDILTLIELVIWMAGYQHLVTCSRYQWLLVGGVSSIALSTAEAEYMALAKAAQEAVWFQQLLGELDNQPARPILSHEDN